MRRAKRKQRRFRLLVLLLLIALALVYQNLNEAQKHFVQNILRQAPYLPARYAV
jgi:CHASE3 domain sensor protein